MRYEFYVSPEGDVRYVDEFGTDKNLKYNKALMDNLALQISEDFKDAWEACLVCGRDFNRQWTSEWLKDYAVLRFIRCNMGNRDILPDWKEGFWNLEEVQCPLRGCCKWENVICHPRPTKMGEEQQKEVAVICHGEDCETAGEILGKTTNAVKLGIYNLKRRMKLTEKQLKKKFKGYHLERRFGLLF